MKGGDEKERCQMGREGDKSRMTILADAREKKDCEIANIIREDFQRVMKFSSNAIDYSIIVFFFFFRQIHRYYYFVPVFSLKILFVDPP